MVKGSKNSAIMFVLAALLLIIQTGISAAVFDDWVGAMVAGTFSFVMFVSEVMAYKGGLSAVMETTVIDTPNYDGSRTRTVYSKDTGQRIQATPCCGICGGIAVIIVAYLFGMEVGSAIVLLAPGFIAGGLAILASIIFVMEYKGPYVGHA